MKQVFFKTKIERSINWNDFSLVIMDWENFSRIIEVIIWKDAFYDMFVNNIWLVDWGAVLFKDNIDKIWKTKEFINIEYGDVFSWEQRKKFIEENTPEWYEYYWDNNYGRTATFVRFI